MFGRTFYADLDIANGAALSDMVDIGDKMIVGIEMPSAWTAASIAFHVASEKDGTFGALRDSAGAIEEVVVDADYKVGLDVALLRASQWRWIKVQSVVVGTPGTGVNQGGDRTVRLVLVQA